jgi:hypothetical protein
MAEYADYADPGYNMGGAPAPRPAPRTRQQFGGMGNPPPDLRIGWYGGENLDEPRSNYPPTPSAGPLPALPALPAFSLPKLPDLSSLGNIGVGTYASGAGTILAFAGQMLAAKQAKQAAAYSTQVGKYNAAVADQNAQAAATAMQIEGQQHARTAAALANDVAQVRQAQQWDEEQQRQQQAYTAGQTQAIIGASGMLMRGSPLAVYEYNLRQSQRQIVAGRYKADLQERALRDQMTMERYATDVAEYGAGERLRVGRAQAMLARQAGAEGAAKAEAQAGAYRTAAFGSLLSGGARTYAMEAGRRASQQQVTDKG